MRFNELFWGVACDNGCCGGDCWNPAITPHPRGRDRAPAHLVIHEAHAAERSCAERHANLEVIQRRAAEPLALRLRARENERKNDKVAVSKLCGQHNHARRGRSVREQRGRDVPWLMLSR